MGTTRFFNAPAVLLLEPDDQIRELVCRILRLAGFAVVATSAGDEAVRACGKHSFTSMVIDVSIWPSVLEGGARRGVGFLHFLQKNSPSRLRRVVITSALFDHELVNELPRVYAVLRKPFDIDELRETVLACSRAEEDAVMKDPDGALVQV